MTGTDRRAGVDGAAEAYLEVLDPHGVEYFFNSPGSEDSPFWEAFAKQTADESPDSRSITHVNCRHESVAVTMAKGYAMVTVRRDAEGDEHRGDDEKQGRSLHRVEVTRSE